jgi:hypothetical protein
VVVLLYSFYFDLFNMLTVVVVFIVDAVVNGVVVLVVVDDCVDEFVVFVIEMDNDEVVGEVEVVNVVKNTVGVEVGVVVSVLLFKIANVEMFGDSEAWAEVLVNSASVLCVWVVEVSIKSVVSAVETSSTVSFDSNIVCSRVCVALLVVWEVVFVTADIAVDEDFAVSFLKITINWDATDCKIKYVLFTMIFLGVEGGGLVLIGNTSEHFCFPQHFIIFLRRFLLLRGLIDLRNELGLVTEKPTLFDQHFLEIDTLLTIALYILWTCW